MELESELNTLNDAIARIAENTRKVDEEEALINLKINALRIEAARLRDQRTAISRELRTVKMQKESVERKLELENQARIVNQKLEEKRKEVQALIDSAPWKDVAFDWQIEGALKLPDRAIIADKRGMGKTLSAIIWRKLHKSKKTLVCLRKEVASDFIKELGIREPGLLVYPMLGVTAFDRQMAAELLNGHEEYVVVTNIESWRRDVETVVNDILRIEIDGIILDEAHHIKRSSTGTAQGFFKLARAVPKVLELTGTPLKNRPQDMYSLFHALYPELFPRESKFLFDYCTQAGQNKWVFSEMGLKALIKLIEGFFIARSPEDIGRQVPPPKMIEYKLDFESHPKQKQAYKDMAELNLAVLGDGDKVVPVISQLAVMTRQAQMLSWPAGIEFKVKDEEGYVVDIVRFDVHQSVKMDWAEDLITELTEEEQRVVLFSRFKPAIYELRDRLVRAGISVAVITGDEKQKGHTKEVFDDFDLKTAHPTDYKYQVLLATYQTVGESANLNAARHIILYDRFWNPGNEDQAIGRIDRLNSTDQATVHVPLVENSFDDYMTALIGEKRELITSVKAASEMQASLTEHLKKTV